MTEEKKYPENQASFEKLAETSPAAITEVDKHGHIVYANSRAEEVLGLEKSEITNRTYDDPDWKITDYEGNDLPSENLPFQLVMRTEEPVYDVRHAIEWPDGKRKLLSVNAAPSFDEGGEFDGVIAVIEDITERMQTKKDLDASEQRYRRLFETAQDGMLILNADTGEIIDANPYIRDLLGFSKQELVGKQLWQIGTFQDVVENRDKFQKLVEEGYIRYEHLPLKTKSGGEAPVEFVSNTYMVNSQKIVQCNIRDITERKRIEERKDHLNSIIRSARKVNRLLVREHERGKLIQGVCDILTETRGYYNTWIALFDESENLLETARSGLGEEFDPMVKLLKNGQFPRRVRETLDADEVLITDDPPVTCEDCPLAANYEGRSSITVRLEHDKKVYGLISASAPEKFLEDEQERHLFEEVAGDIALGLHGIEVEESLRRSEKQFRQAIHLAPFPVMIHAEDGEVVAINERWLNVTGYGEEDISTISDWTKRAYGQAENDIKAHVDKLYDLNDRIDEGEYEVKTKEGQTRIWDFSSAPIGKTTDGRRLVLSMADDVTARKHAELKAEGERDRAQKYLDVAGSIIVLIDRDRKVKEINQKGCEILGYKKEEILGKDWYKNFVPEEAREKVLDDTRKPLMAGDLDKAKRYENPILTSEGEERTIAWENTIIEDDGKIVGTLSSGIDITERVKAKGDLEENEKRFRSYIENSPFGIFIANSEGNYVEVNKTACDITGYKREELLDMDLVDLIPEGYKEKAKDSFNSLATAGEVSTEVPFIRKGGAKRYWKVSTVKLTDNRFLGFTEDITERKQMEEQIKQDREELKQSFIELAETTSRVLGVRDPYTQKHEQRVGELAREVGRRMGLSEEKLLGLYLGGVLHDIGKIAIPETIMTKPGKLNDIEWQMIRSHPEVGYNQILEDTDFPWPVAEMTLHHHERLDGSGYPNGLEGEELTTEVRILGAVDVVEAMSTRRPYRTARTVEETLEEIESGRGMKYDPEVVDILVELIDEGKIEFGCLWQVIYAENGHLKVQSPATNIYRNTLG